ncbi:short chain dehydrogenase [Steroidobacter agaridevorans]|uniref:Short chain dehydrogenase n=1 Tax=Steroidobacter agaridevorans TaxID=2695856 RepID=A0A829Y497_9GAMM|nr:SDR family NAD(P)-dependent oxidoreductase [Steroidobacter agaridevorans]GFE78024.1 short chain dehydrogenase [Steroidobacter agaridevorans]GFE91083.1 short chain dehydrogenase [Steroidobacter agaridevorans]
MSARFTRLNARFPHKRVFITGAGSGLGLEVAKALAADGWTLGLFDRNLERLTTVEAQFAEAGVKVVAYPGDVTQADELTVAVNSFAATHDGLDVMINNAGVAGGGSMMEVSLEDWRWIIDINVMGVVHGSRAAIPHLQRNGSGLLINVASAAAFASAPGMISYNATKAAVVSISETLVNELRPVGTQVSVVMPTFFRSSLLETFRGPAHARLLANKATQRSEYPVEQAAQDLLTASADGRTYIVLPKAARTMWRMKRWMPLRFLDRVRDFTQRQPQTD